jgi:hypothetical protein
MRGAVSAVCPLTRLVDLRCFGWYPRGARYYPSRGIGLATTPDALACQIALLDRVRSQ